MPIPVMAIMEYTNQVLTCSAGKLYEQEIRTIWLIADAEKVETNANDQMTLDESPIGSIADFVRETTVISGEGREGGGAWGM